MIFNRRKYCGLCVWFRKLKHNMDRCEWHEFRRGEQDDICKRFEGYADEDDFNERKLSNVKVADK